MIATFQAPPPRVGVPRAPTPTTAAAPGLRGWRDRWRRWRAARRAQAELDALDDRMRADIGLDRGPDDATRRDARDRPDAAWRLMAARA